MSRNERLEIAPGAVFEFYESKEILCGVVLVVKDGRFNALSEHNREVGLTLSRIVYHGKTSLDLKLSRDELVQELRSISENRKSIMDRIGLEEIWLLLQSEEAGYGAEEIAEFIFNTPISDDQAAAVKRLLLSDRLYFQAQGLQILPSVRSKRRGAPHRTAKGSGKGAQTRRRGKVGRKYAHPPAKCSPDRIP